MIGGTLWGNRGAEAMVSTTIGRLRDRDPNAGFLLMSYMPRADADLTDAPHVTVMDGRPQAVALVHLPFAVLCWLAGLVGLRWPDALLPGSVRALRDCRALFDVSGISFIDDRLPVVAYNLLCGLPAVLLGVPLVRLSQAMGPFRRPLNRWPARWLMSRAMHTFARGRHTSNHLRELGIPDDRWSVVPDIAFAYRPADSLTVENEDRVARLGEQLAAVEVPIVAVVPSAVVLQRSQAGDGDYLGLLVEVVRELQHRGRHVLVIPNATRAGVDRLRNNDLPVIERLLDRLGDEPDIDPEGVSSVDHDVNSAAIRSLIAGCELVITSRFHAMVAALALGIPPLVVGWSHKYEEVLEMFGLAEAAVDHARAERELIPMLDRALENRDEARARIGTALPQITVAAVGQFDVLDRINGPDLG